MRVSQQLDQQGRILVERAQAMIDRSGEPRSCMSEDLRTNPKYVEFAYVAERDALKDVDQRQAQREDVRIIELSGCKVTILNHVVCKASSLHCATTASRQPDRPCCT